MDRRKFLAFAAAAPLAAQASVRAWSQSPPPNFGRPAGPIGPWVVPDAALPSRPLTEVQQRRVGMTTTGFRSLFPIRNGFVFDPAAAPRPESFSYLDAPAFVLEKTGLKSMEVWTMQFEDFGDDYLRQLREKARHVGVRLTNIQVDDGHEELGNSDEGKRAASIAYFKKWIDRATVLGVPSLRFNPGGGMGPTSPDAVPYDLVVDSYRQLADYGKRKKIKVLVENHTGYTNNIETMAEILKRANNRNLRAIIDWGNGKGGSGDPLAERMKLVPWLYLVSAKAGNFDDNYRMTDFDVAEYVRATETRGFRGLYSIEVFGGRAPDPVRAVASIRDTILANLSA